MRGPQFRSARVLPSLRRRPPGALEAPPAPPPAGGSSPLLAFEVAELPRRRRRRLSLRGWILMFVCAVMSAFWITVANIVASVVRSFR